MLLFRLLPPAPATQELAWDRLHDCVFFVLTPVYYFSTALSKSLIHVDFGERGYKRVGILREFFFDLDLFFFFGGCL